MVYTKEFLISELQKFELENGKSPKMKDMQISNGYPSVSAFKDNFGSWNKALLAAKLKVNQLDGTETCDNCGKVKPENQGWNYKNDKRLCNICNKKLLSDYMNGNLDSDSSTGFAFMSQRVVAKTLGLDLKYDCNCSIGFNAPDDLYDSNKYKYTNVKTSVLNNKNFWKFNFKNKYIPDTYIMLGFSANKSDILHVWITEPEDDLTFDEKNFKYKQSIGITNDINSGLNRAEPWEVDCESYNDVYHSMSLENCSVLRSD